jgi:hypothetical protein
MRTRITHLTLILSALSMILFASAGAGGQDLKLASGDDLFRAIPGENPHAFIGTWLVTTQVATCPGAPPAPTENFSKMVSANAGGTLSETSSSTLFRSVAFGVWEHLGQRDFVYAQRFFRFNTDGTLAGGVQAKWSVLMGEDGDAYTATGDIRITLPNGTVVATRCGTETGTRMVIPE